MRLLERTQRLDLNRHVGTVLEGVDLLELDDDGVTDLLQLVAERGVVAVRNQPMTLEQHIEFGRRLGPLHVHPAYADKEHPEALRIHTDENSRFTAGESWHSDVSCELEPPAVSILRIEVTPSCGGDTAYASMYRAFETLSDTMQEILVSLDAVHAGDLPFRGVYGSTSSKEYPRNEHPVVRTHPLTGRSALYVNSGFTERISGLRRNESDALLRMLFEHCARPEFVYRHRWETGDAVLWDNRCTMHHAVADFRPEHGHRHLHRTTVLGDEPAR